MSGASREAERALAALDRRGFLRLTGACAALGLVPTGVAAAPAHLAPPPGAPLRVLSERGYAVFTAAAARLVGGPGAEWIALGRVRPGLAADAWLARTPALGAALGQGLVALEFAPWPVLPKLRPFTSLEADDQDTVLADLVASRFDWKVDLFRGLKALTAATFYGDPAVRPLIGHPGPFGDPATRAAAMTYDVEAGS